MQQNRTVVRRKLFVSEGGYTVDKGGPTMRGVTLATFQRWRKDSSLGVEDLKALTEDEAWQIFEVGYLDPIHFDDLPAGLDYAMADFSVNSGPGGATRHLQKTLNTRFGARLQLDGVMGTRTLEAIDKTPLAQLINTLLDDRLSWMRTLDNWPQAGKGWTNRIRDVRAAAVQMANASPAAPPAPAAPKGSNTMSSNNEKAVAPPAADGLPQVDILAGLANTFENLAHSIGLGRTAVVNPDVPTTDTERTGLRADIEDGQTVVKEILEAVAHARSGSVKGTISDVLTLATTVFGALDRHGIKVPAATSTLKIINSFVG